MTQPKTVTRSTNPTRKTSVRSVHKKNTISKNWQEGGSRDERGRLIREALFKAAAETVGDVGYEAASVAMITQRAGVAHGTFYNYFETRQDVFDELLPTIGKQMLSHIRKCAEKGKNMLEKEEFGFAGFFSFLKDNPHFFRILNEAESFAPNAYRAHMELVSQDYVRFFQRSAARGELAGYEEPEFEVIAFLLMAARSYLAWRFVREANKVGNVPDWVVKVYAKFIRSGLACAQETCGQSIIKPLIDSGQTDRRRSSRISK